MLSELRILPLLCFFASRTGQVTGGLQQDICTLVRSVSVPSASLACQWLAWVGVADPGDLPLPPRLSLFYFPHTARNKSMLFDCHYALDDLESHISSMEIFRQPGPRSVLSCGTPHSAQHQNSSTSTT